MAMFFGALFMAYGHDMCAVHGYRVVRFGMIVSVILGRQCSGYQCAEQRESRAHQGFPEDHQGE